MFIIRSAAECRQWERWGEAPALLIGLSGERAESACPPCGVVPFTIFDGERVARYDGPKYVEVRTASHVPASEALVKQV